MNPYKFEKLKKFLAYFTITPSKNNLEFTYEVNTDAVKKLMEGDGCFYIFSTEKDAKTTKILDNYRSKDIIEKLFGQIKLGMNVKPTRNHKSFTTDGKTFAVFITSIIRAELMNKLSYICKIQHQLLIKSLLNCRYKNKKR
jgi:transposase